MRIKPIVIALIMGCAAVSAAQRPLRIYLSQDVQVGGDTVVLGDIGIVLGDGDLADRANAITLGTFAVEGQVLRIDRHTLLSRLASSGISTSQVQMLGAETVEVRRNELIVAAERIVACAQRYLEQATAAQKGVEMTLLRAPQSKVVQVDGGAIELLARQDARQGGGVRRITVAIMQDGRQVGTEDVIFSVRYQVRRLIAAEDLSPGSVLTSENVRIETTLSNQPEPDGWAVPYGMVTRQRVAEGGTVVESQLEPKQLPVVIQRRQNVVIRIDTGGLFVSASGEAMDEGRIGEIIRVRRGQRPQERIINCRVQPDGTVEPVL